MVTKKRKLTPFQEAQRRAVMNARADEARKIRERFARRELTPEIADAIRETRSTVVRARNVISQAEGRIDAAVIKLRALGCSWDQIAAATDLSRQGAMKRHAAAIERATAVASEGQQESA